MQPASFRAGQNENAVQGILDPLQQSVADVFRPTTGGVNVASAAPILYQANGMIVHAINQAMPNPVTGFAAGAMDGVMGVINGVSNVVAPIMQLPETAARDASLNGRARLYASMISSDATLALAPGHTIYDLANPIGQFQNLISTITGDNHTASKIAADAIDLPDSVKTAIAADPTLVDNPAKLNKLLDDAGRQWTWEGGIGGIIGNVGPSLLVLAAEAILTGGAAAYIRGAGLASEIPQVVGITKGVSTVLSAAMKLNKIALASGITQFGVTAAIDGIARYTGNQAALDFANTAFSYHPISDNPNVQLLTSFTVNPFEGLGLAKKGIIKVANSLDVKIGPVLGARLVAAVGNDDSALRLLGTTYGIDRPSVPNVVTKYFGDRIGVVKDHLMQLAAQVVVDGLPDTERAYLNTFTDPALRSEAVLRQYAAPIIDVLQHKPEELARIIQKDAWTYRQGVGPYDPYDMLALQTDFGEAKIHSYQFRSEMQAVVGYPAVVLPEAAANVRTALSQIAGDTLPANWVNEQTRLYAGLREYIPGLPKAADGSVARADFETLLQRADQDYQKLAGTNPVLAKTGSSPVLRPDATHQEWSDALGSDPKVTESFLSGDPKVNPDAMRGYLAGHKDILGLNDEQIAAMSPEEAWQTAADHIDGVTAPWVKAGKDVASSELAYRAFSDQAAQAAAAGNKAEAERLLKLAAQSDATVRAAYGPLDSTFAERVANAEAAKGTPSAALRDAARRKVDAQSRLDQVQALYDQVASHVADVNGRPLAEPARLLNMLHTTPEGNWAFDPTAPSVPGALRAKLAAFLPHTEDARVSVTEADNRTLWKLVQKYQGQSAGRERFNLTAGQRTALKNAAGKLDASIEDYMPREYAGTEDAFLADLVKFRNQRDGLLGPTSEARLQRSYSATVPQQYLDAAQMENVLTHDYVYEAQGITTRGQQILAMLNNVNDPAVFGELTHLVEDTPILRDDLATLAQAKGEPLETFLGDPANANAIRSALPNPIGPTPLDEALIKAVASGDPAEMDAALKQVGDVRDMLGQPKPPIPNVPLDVAQTVLKDAKKRLSVTFDERLRSAQADFTARPDAAMLAKDPVGKEILSLVGWGVPGRVPTSIGDVLTILRSLENGRAQDLGFGPVTLARAQKLAESLLDNAARKATRDAAEAGFPVGMTSKGAYWSKVSPDSLDLGRRLIQEGRVVSDPANPFGLQYGFKGAPKGEVTTEFEYLRQLADEHGVPSLAEELFNSNFQPFTERLATAKLRQATNWIFGPHSNASIIAHTKSEFIARAARLGATPEESNAVWKAWTETASDSNLPKVLQRSGKYRAVRGDQSLMGSRANIPNGKLLETAQKALQGSEDRVISLPWHNLFREASSAPMRFLADAHIPFGQKLEGMYGAVTNNNFVRMGYYLFRFAGDFRYHALNYFEGAMLYAGRAALKPGEAPPGWLGASHDWLARSAEDPALDTGFPFSRSRAAWMEKTYRKEQLGAQTTAMEDLARREPELMASFRDLVQKDPELSQTIAAFGDTPEGYLNAMDQHYQRVLGAIDPSGAFDEDIAAAMAAEPAMQEVYGRIAEVNRQLWGDVKETFLGNPNRSRLERGLNHYLLFWPLSYQLKSAKWLLKVMYDSAGGLPTNGFGAYAANQLVARHNQMLKDDPKYATWIKDNPTLLFAAQSFFPTTWNSMGVSMSPILRDAIFGRSKAILDIGPVYTASTYIPNVAGDLYKTFHDIPGADVLYRALSGRQPPKLNSGVPAP